jgi:SAM-dependent methyltransferase
MENSTHDNVPVSQWVERWLPGIAAGGEVLDLACGSGRHSRLIAAAGRRVCALDRDPVALGLLAGVAGVTAIQADLEQAPWPLVGRKFDGIVVTNYLHRPLFPWIIDALAPQGLLIYETFAAGNERFGSPSNPAFLLRPGELLEHVARRLRVIAYEDMEVTLPRPAMVQRICARLSAV